MKLEKKYPLKIEIDGKTSADISNDIAELEKEQKKLLEDNHTLIQAIGELSLEIAKLTTKKKELQIAEEKSSYILKQNKIDLSMLRAKFWSVKDSGL